nr:hypothetical protein [Tanacetum cinerariifolium]
MQDDKLELVELKEVVEVFATAKLMTKVVTTAAATITTADTPITTAALNAAPSAARRRKGVVIRDLEETATPSIIIHYEPKSKDKGKRDYGDRASLKKGERRQCCNEVSSIEEEATNRSPSQKEHDLSEEYGWIQDGLL